MSSYQQSIEFSGSYQQELGQQVGVLSQTASSEDGEEQSGPGTILATEQIDFLMEPRKMENENTDLRLSNHFSF